MGRGIKARLRYDSTVQTMQSLQAGAHCGKLCIHPGGTCKNAGNGCNHSCWLCGNAMPQQALLLRLRFIKPTWLGAQIMDARDFSKGPVCRLWLQHHVPHGLHGFFTEQQF